MATESHLRALFDAEAFGQEQARQIAEDPLYGAAEAMREAGPS